MGCLETDVVAPGEGVSPGRALFGSNVSAIKAIKHAQYVGDCQGHETLV